MLWSRPLRDAPAERDVSAENPFRALDETALRALLLRVRLYAEWKVRSTRGSDVDLDAEDLALRAVEQTLDGTRRFNRERFSLLKHLTNCIDSYVSHHYASPAHRRRARPTGDGAFDPLEHASATAPGPEDAVSHDREVAALVRHIEQSHPRLAPLLALVVDGGESLADRERVARRLGYDPGNSAEMQRVYRRINALKDAVTAWRRGAEADS